MLKNLVAFRIAPNWPLTTTQIEERMEQHAFRECAALQTQSIGWVGAREGFPVLVSAGGHLLLTLRVDTKKVPGATLKKELAFRLRSLSESRGGKKIGGKQKKEIKAQILDEMLPEIVPVEAYISIWIDPKNHWLGMNATSSGKISDAISMLYQTLDGVDITLQREFTADVPSSKMASWLAAGEGPAEFSIDDSCELIAADSSKATVRYANTNLDCENVKEHLRDGKTPTKLAMTFDDRVSFVLTHKCELRKLKLLDIVFRDAQEAEDVQENFQGTLMIAGAEMTRVLDGLVNALGGFQEVDATTSAGAKSETSVSEEMEPLAA